MHLLFCLPGTGSGPPTGLPSGGLSPTMLGSWVLGGGWYTGVLGPDSWSRRFGTSKWGRSGAKEGGGNEREMKLDKGGEYQSFFSTVLQKAKPVCL